MKLRWLIACGALIALPGAFAQHATPYAGQETREIKALSDADVKQHLAGAGLGYARAAELNRFPGPMHALELADQLKLTPEQRRRLEKLMAEHKAEARALGAKLVEAERALDRLFRSGQVSASELGRLTRAAAAAQGEYRLSHLETHRRTRDELTSDQIARYDELRG